MGKERDAGRKGDGKAREKKPGEKKPGAKAALKARIAELEARIAGILGSVAGVASGPAVSPLAPDRFPAMPAVAGVRFATVAAGVRYRNRTDVMLAEIAPGSTMAGLFTRSSTRAAPVLWCEERLAALAAAEGNAAGSAPFGIVVNSGNANAFTGRNGIEAASAVADAAAAALGTSPQRIFLASTGVIGEPLPAERITAKLAETAAALTPDGFEAAARAIMTTDTFPKGAVATAEIDGAPVTVAGIAKGSGMIAPDMATMLVFLFTDAAVAPKPLQAMLGEINERTFNAITVDGDTSTSDTLLLAATAKAPMRRIESRRDPRARPLAEALEAVMRDLALQVVRDGEGATKIATITVTGAKTVAAARRIGLAIANSPLVKTAMAGEDPNWGRIVMAVGKSGEAADRDRLTIRFGDILVAEQGWVSPRYREADGAAYMKRAELEIAVDVGVGEAEATVWTCDLTKRYVEINADYRS